MAEKYEKIETVGQGSFGHVYKFRKKGTGAFVAVGFFVFPCHDLVLILASMACYGWVHYQKLCNGLDRIFFF